MYSAQTRPLCTLAGKSLFARIRVLAHYPGRDRLVSQRRRKPLSSRSDAPATPSSGPGVADGSPWIELSAPPRPPISGFSTNSKRASPWVWVVPARWYSPHFTIRNPPRLHPLAPNGRQQAPDRQGVCVERRPPHPLHAGLLSVGAHARLPPFQASAGDLGTT